jgi:hypothetical protein
MTNSNEQFLADPKLRASTAFLAGIGHVCLQWALLELTLLALLCAIEEMPTEEGDLVFGGLDMQARVNTAISLARHHKLPRLLIVELEAVRRSLQKGRILERRNQAVHGAHAETEEFGTFQLRMSRWPVPKKLQRVSVEDMLKLTEEVHELQRRTVKVMDQFGDWKFGHLGAA